MLALLFALALAVPPLGWVFGRQGATLSENRNLAAPPDFRRTQIKDLPARIDVYYGDHVGFRGAIIRASGLLLHRYLGESSADVIVGKSPSPGQPPWYFYASQGIIEDRLGLGQLTPAQLESWRRTLESRTKWLQRRGQAYLFVIVPEKSSVYPELLPDYIQTHLASTRLDQLSRYLKAARSPVVFLDLRHTLRQAKPGGDLYFPFDTHWNGRGMFHAYEGIMAALQPFFPDLSADRMGTDFEIRARPDSLHADLAWMLGLTATSTAPLLAVRGDAPAKYAPSPWPAGFDPSLNTNDGAYALERPGRGRRVLVFHDSFFVSPLFSRESQPLAAHFARSYFAWLPPTDAALKRFVEMENPDLVVEEHGERSLRLVPPPPAPLDPLTPQLRRSAIAPAFAIEKINTRRYRPDAVLSANGELRIEGWAFDTSSRRPAAAVEIMIDGVPQPASYGLDRSDPEPSGCDACKETGFVADLSAAGLSPGPHTLGIRVISADGASYTETNWGRFRIDK